MLRVFSENAVLLRGDGKRERRQSGERGRFHNKSLDHPEKFTDTTRQEVDMLPFGSLSEDGKTITWPADNALSITFK